jgi:hypothetical protein
MALATVIAPLKAGLLLLAASHGPSVSASAKQTTITVSTQQSTIAQGQSLTIAWRSKNAPAGARVALWRADAVAGKDVLIQYGQPATGRHAAYVRRDREPRPRCPVGGSSRQWPTGCWDVSPWPAGTYKITAKLYVPNGNLRPLSYLATSDSSLFKVTANPY